MRMRKYVHFILSMFVLVIVTATASSAYTLLDTYLANKSGQYKWGNNSSHYYVKPGWEAAVEGWNNEGMNISYHSNSQNTLGGEYLGSSNMNGTAVITPYPSSTKRTTVKQFDCYLNVSKLNWNATRARSTALHEIGHVIGLNHSWNYFSIMRDDRDRDEINTIQTDDISGVNAIYR